jgi:retron-type reverse transcriptase
VPQGGILSPLLSNVYLHELDTFMEKIKKEYHQEGDLSKTSNEYRSQLYRVNKIKAKISELREKFKIKQTQEVFEMVKKSLKELTKELKKENKLMGKKRQE